MRDTQKLSRIRNRRRNAERLATARLEVALLTPRLTDPVMSSVEYFRLTRAQSVLRAYAHKPRRLAVRGWSCPDRRATTATRRGSE